MRISDTHKILIVLGMFVGTLSSTPSLAERSQEADLTSMLPAAMETVDLTAPETTGYVYQTKLLQSKQADKQAEMNTAGSFHRVAKHEPNRNHDRVFILGGSGILPM